MPTVLDVARDVTLLLSAGMLLIHGIRAARQSKTITDNVEKGALAYHDVRGDDKADTSTEAGSRKSRGLRGDVNVLFNTTADLSKRLSVAEQERERDRTEHRRELHEAKAMMAAMLAGIGVPTDFSKPRDLRQAIQDRFKPERERESFDHLKARQQLIASTNFDRHEVDEPATKRKP